MITLEDIAQTVGVSHSTVSRALAGSPLVNKETAERIKRVAREAGYQVNQIARNLKTRSTRTIGLIVPEVSNPFYPRLIQGIADQLRTEGFSLQLHLSGSNQESEATCLVSLFENRADGVLLVTGEAGLQSREQIEAFANAGVPIILMGWAEGVSNIDIVTGDDAAGGYALAKHLTSFGHRRIAIVGKPPHRGKYDRINGFIQALQEDGVQLSDEMVLFAQSVDEVRTAINALTRLPEPPTAIFAYQDSIALHVYKCLGELGISIPGQMSVAGFDDLELASVVSPPLTTVGGHIEPLTERFVRLLLARIRQEDTSSSQLVIVTPNLIARGSTHAPPLLAELTENRNT